MGLGLGLEQPRRRTSAKTRPPTSPTPRPTPRAWSHLSCALRPGSWMVKGSGIGDCGPSTRAPTQALLGTQAARALLSGPEGSPAVVASGEVGGRVSSCTPGHFDHAEDPSGRSTLARRSRGPGGGSTHSSSRSCRCCRTRCCCSSSCTRSRGWARQSASVSPWECGLGGMLQRRESGRDPCLAVRRTEVSEGV